MADSGRNFPQGVDGNTCEQSPNYTGSPWQLFFADMRLFFRNRRYLPNIFLPLFPWPSGPLDELAPSVPNLFDMALHSVLFAFQVIFLLSLPLVIFCPFWIFTLYVGVFVSTNTLICQLLNGGIPEDGLKSTEDEQSHQWAVHEDEYWIFLNGICVGKHWLQNNIDRISRSFHRPVVGVHNETSGVIFDLIQCLIQRSLSFASDDVRQCYVLVKRALYRRGIRKVVLILHSQGGIEGGIIADWLLNEVPHDLLQYLEIYTFGCIANHFNNPCLLPDSHATAVMRDSHRAISHIEHYANLEDPASRFGVLHFARETPEHSLDNRFMGTVFVNPTSGHQLNQHYLDRMFPLDLKARFTRDPAEGDFMDMEIAQQRRSSIGTHGKVFVPRYRSRTTGVEVLDDSATPKDEYLDRTGQISVIKDPKVCDLSRLWLYRNGGSPAS